MRLWLLGAVPGRTAFPLLLIVGWSYAAFGAPAEKPLQGRLANLVDALAAAEDGCSRGLVLLDLHLTLLNEVEENHHAALNDVLARIHATNVLRVLARDAEKTRRLNRRVEQEILTARRLQVLAGRTSTSLAFDVRLENPIRSVRVGASKEPLRGSGTRGDLQGLHFHGFQIKGDLARVTLTPIMPDGIPREVSWTAIYRRGPDSWQTLSFEPLNDHSHLFVQTNLPVECPHPNKLSRDDERILRLALELRMERVRARDTADGDVLDWATRLLAKHWAGYSRLSGGRPKLRHQPNLLIPYLESDSPLVRRLAESQLTYNQALLDDLDELLARAEADAQSAERRLRWDEMRELLIWIERKGRQPTDAERTDLRALTAELECSTATRAAREAAPPRTAWGPSVSYKFIVWKDLAHATVSLAHSGDCRFLFRRDGDTWRLSVPLGGAIY